MMFLIKFLIVILLNYSLHAKSTTPSSRNFQFQSEWNHYPFMKDNIKFEQNDSKDIILTNKLGLIFSKSIKNYHGVMDASMIHTSTDSSNLYFDVREVYFSKKFINDWSITLGRKKYNWSWADHFTQRNLWNPSFYLNPLDRSQNGLTGFFLQSPKKENGLSGILFLTSFFSPNTTHRIEEKGQSIDFSNPWSPKLPRYVSFANKDIPIRYKITFPYKYSNFLWRYPGFAAKIKWQQGLFQAASSWAYKPMNFLPTSVPIILNISESTPYADLNIRPVIHYQKLRSQELQWKKGKWNWKFDWTHDQPEDSKNSIKGSNFLSTNTNSANIYTFAAFTELPFSSRKVGVFGGHSYIDSDVINSRSFDEYKTPSRYILTNSTFLGTNDFLSYFLNSKFKSQSVLFYDWIQRGIYLQSLIFLQWSKKFSAYLKIATLDIVGDKGESGFVSNFQENDNYTIGIRYVF